MSYADFAMQIFWVCSQGTRGSRVLTTRPLVLVELADWRLDDGLRYFLPSFHTTAWLRVV